MHTSSSYVLMLSSLFSDTQFSNYKTLKIRSMVTCAILLVFHQESFSQQFPLISSHPLTLSQWWTVVWAAASQVTWENRRPCIPAGHNFALRGFPPLPPLCFCTFLNGLPRPLLAFFSSCAALLYFVIMGDVSRCADVLVRMALHSDIWTLLFSQWPCSELFEWRFSLVTQHCFN